MPYFQYTTDFDDIDEEVHFWEMVVAAEKHFDVIVDSRSHKFSKLLCRRLLIY